MTAAAPVTDAPAAPAAMVKTCRREIPCDPVMTRRSCCERQSVGIIANRFAWRRTNRAQTRRNGFCLRLIAQRGVGWMLRATPARVYIKLTCVYRKSKSERIDDEVRPVPVGNLIRLASEAESRNVSIL